MFGFFKSKSIKPQPTVTPEDKGWIEEQMLWMIKAFGLDHLKQRPFILPEEIKNLTGNLTDPVELQKLLQQMCSYWQLDPSEIEVKLFDDLLSKQWSDPLRPIGSSNSPAGFYQQKYTTDKKRFVINLAKSNFEHPEFLVNVMSHELAHVKLLGGHYITRDHPDLEPMTDLTVIYFGFGLFAANCFVTEIDNGLRRSGYLPAEVIAYANALICFITGLEAANYQNIFNSNTRELFRKNSEFLAATDDTNLVTHKVRMAENVYQADREYLNAYEKKDFDQVVRVSKQRLTSDPKEVYVLNNLGYALLQQKKYEEAISIFTKGIEIDPYSDYPFNNRGYCKLQLGDWENAFADLDHSYEMNPDNSYSWRNLGAFYLATGDAEKALEYFENSQKIDAKTEMINFYLSHVHSRLGNSEKAKEFARLSEEAKEHNDSILDPI